MLYYRILAKKMPIFRTEIFIPLIHQDFFDTYYDLTEKIDTIHTTKKKRILLRNYYFVEKSTLKRLKILPVGGRP